MELKWKIDTKITKKGEEYLYLDLLGVGKYPITNIEKDENGDVMIMFPCLYLPKSMKDELGKDAEVYREIVEKGSDYGRVEFAEDGEWDKLWGDKRLISKSVNERIDGEMTLVYNKKENKVWFSREYRK